MRKTTAFAVLVAGILVGGCKDDEESPIGGGVVRVDASGNVVKGESRLDVDVRGPQGQLPRRPPAAPVIVNANNNTVSGESTLSIDVRLRAKGGQ